MNTTDTVINSLLFLATVHLVVLLIVLIFALWQLGRIWTGKVKHLPEKLVAAGLTAAFFPNTLFQALIYPIYRLIENLQKLFYISYQYLLADGHQDQLDKLAKSTPLDEKAVSISEVVSRFPFAMFLTYHALAVVFYAIIRSFRDHSFKLPPAGSFKIKKFNAQNIRIITLNVLISICLLCSLYIVISVFVTIPYLNEMKKPSQFTQRMLDSVLTMMAKTDTIQKKQIPPTPFVSTFSSDSVAGSADLKAKYSALPPERRRELNFQISVFQQANKFADINRQENVRKINDYYDDYKQDKVRMQNELSTTFQTNSGNIAIDKSSMYHDLVTSFENYLSFTKRYYNDAITHLSVLDLANSNQYHTTSANLKQLFSYMLGDTSRNFNDISVYVSASSGAAQYQDYNDVLISNTTSMITTSYEKNGSDWGFLGWTASYLIKTKSLELVLLVGMIGFGILGAAILSFVPMDDFFKTFSQKAMILNFPNVLARGFGAALIIYLATKGGIAIFSMGNNTSDPNGYILLLTCFIGAVFSEKVWSKMSNYLTTGQGQNQGQFQGQNQEPPQKQPSADKPAK